MKNILFCLLLLLACFRTGNVNATAARHICKFDNIHQETYYSGYEDFLKSSGVLLELLEDEITDPEDETLPYASVASAVYFSPQFIYSLYLNTVCFSRNCFSPPLPVFILHRAFRI